MVDDEPTNITVIVAILGTQYRTQVATSGRKAIELAGLLPPPELILLDLIMPEMDGCAVLQVLKENPQTRKIPVIITTGDASPENQARCSALGCADYLTKPIDPHLLRSRVKELLRSSS